jgi:hypothetical protein
MSEKEHLDKEQLLSAYIDGQLTPRQLTELKRLLAHDSLFQKELEAMEYQRRLLQSLPVETAPAMMAEEIRTVLERRFILADSVHHVDKSGLWGLRVRKVAAAAAMILLPLLVLGAVVYTILQPSEPVPGMISEPVTMKIESAVEPLFSAVLQFQTSQPIAANDFIEKKIHTLGLMNFTTPQRQSDRTSYKIVCSRQYIEGLVGELEELWPRCQKASYAILDAGTNQPVRVESIDPQQTLAMIGLADISAAAKLAQNISEQNAQKAIAKTDPAAAAPPQLPAKASKPILAWDEGRQQAAAAEANTICLVIEVLGQ